MGSGCWTTQEYSSYSASIGRTYDAGIGALCDTFTSAQEVYKSTKLDESMNPRNVIRECCDTEEHPETFPVILALDVTGSMGSSALEVAKKLNVIMTKAYDSVKDVEFAIMGIGDLAYDRAPIQMSQFESDIRIAENLDKIWFEGGGGRNAYESYTAAWWMGLKHSKLDCWKRGKKGLIITLGDEQLNPYLPKRELTDVSGDNLQAVVETKNLFKEVSEKFDVKHIVVEHGTFGTAYFNDCQRSFAEVIGSENVFISSVENVTDRVSQIIADAAKTSKSSNQVKVDQDGLIHW